MFSLAVTFSSAAVFAFLGIVFSFLANANYMFIFLSARMNSKTASGKAVAAIDARMGEVYIGVYERDSRGFPVLLGEERVLAPEKALAAVRELIGDDEIPAVIGTGFGAYPEMVGALNGVRTGESLPWADSLVRLALRDWELSLAQPPEEVLPVYIRDQVTWKKISDQERERQSRKV